VLGDDVPSMTDCWLTVQECNTYFWVHRSIWEVGDLNKDNRVDMQDMGVVYSALGSNWRNYYWNSIADIDDNGKVNYRDLGLEFGFYLGYQTRYYTSVPSGIEMTATAFGQAIKEIARKYP
jgi:hypothetical protein